MNYIELINQFWRIRRGKPITAYEADLYYYLMNECNRGNWLNPFNLSTNLICAELGISRKTLSDLRNRLKQKGLIDFIEGQKNKSSAVYKLIYVTESNIQGNVLGNIQGNILGNHKYKNKTSNKIPPIIPQQDLPFTEDEPKRKSSKVKKEFVPPTIDEVLKFFSGSLLPDWENQGQLFFSHYNSQGWRKGTGVQVTDWDSLANKWILDEKIKRNERSTRSKANNPASGNEYAGK